jgi:hypothetical protein
MISAPETLSLQCLSRRLARISPAPIANLRQVLAMKLHVAAVFNDLVAQELLHMAGNRRRSLPPFRGHPIETAICTCPASGALIQGNITNNQADAS